MKYLLLSSLLIVSFAISGCAELWATRAATRVFQPVSALDEIEGDPLALSAVKSIAIFPVANNSGNSSFDSMSFSTKFANQLASKGLVRVTFPRQVIREVEILNDQILRHNQELRKLILLGKDPAKERTEKLIKGIPLTADRDVELKILDPVNSLADAIKIGRILKVDAVLMSKVTDFDPYYRPRLAITVEAVTTGHSAEAAKTLARLTQWGIPASQTSPHGVAWYRQQVFDTRDGGTSRDLYLFARNHHTEDRPFDTEVYLRSMDRFYEFVGGTIGEKFLGAKAKATKMVLDKAAAEAKKRRLDQEKIRARVRSLVYPTNRLPSQNEVADKNIKDRRNRSWRPDIYGKMYPSKVKNTRPEKPKGAYFKK